MKHLALEDLVGLDRYEQIRDEFRRRIIALKRDRRVAVGDRMTFVFENRDTVLFQTQEMLRAEHIVDLDRVREELAVYNELLPAPGELSATLLIEITDSEHIRDELVRLLGIDRCVAMRFGDDIVVPAVFESGRAEDDKLSAVQYVRFPLTERARQALLSGTVPVTLVVDHPNYRASRQLSDGVRASLAADLAG